MNIASLELSKELYELSGNSKYIRAEWAGKPYHPDHAKDDIKDLFLELAQNLHKYSESGAADHQCSQEGYEYGLEDFMKEVELL